MSRLRHIRRRVIRFILAEELKQIEDRMSAVSDALAALKASGDAAVARVTADVANFNSELETLRTQVVAPEDLAMIVSLTNQFNALDPTNPATLPTPAPTPAPTPEPAPPTTPVAAAPATPAEPVAPAAHVDAPAPATETK